MVFALLHRIPHAHPTFAWTRGRQAYTAGGFPLDISKLQLSTLFRIFPRWACRLVTASLLVAIFNYLKLLWDT